MPASAWELVRKKAAVSNFLICMRFSDFDFRWFFAPICGISLFSRSFSTSGPNVPSEDGGSNEPRDPKRALNTSSACESRCETTSAMRQQRLQILAHLMEKACLQTQRFA